MADRCVVLSFSGDIFSSLVLPLEMDSSILAHLRLPATVVSPIEAEVVARSVAEVCSIEKALAFFVKSRRPIGQLSRRK